MRRVPLSRAAQLHPFLRALDHLGAPTEGLIEQHKLPPRLLEGGGGLVSTRAAFSFVEDIGRRQGIDDFGWRVADPQLAQMSPRLRRALMRCHTLLSALEQICARASGESSNLAFWFEEQQDAVFFCHRGSLEVGAPGADAASLTRTAIVISAIRLFMGPDWVPVECGLALEGEIGPVVREGLRDAPVRRTPDHGWLRLPRSILAHPPQTRVPVQTRTGTEADKEPSLDLVDSLAQLVRPYLSRKPPTIEAAADLAGMSVRTLQRDLAAAGTSYRDLLLGVKLDSARELLRQPEVKMLEIAGETGFNDPAHFSRFVKAMTGMNPREYRSTLLGDHL